MTRPIYAVIDERTGGGERVVSEHSDPRVAVAVAEALRCAGSSSARVEIFEAADPLEAEAWQAETTHGGAARDQAGGDPHPARASAPGAAVTDGSSVRR
jgi:hypothetical protein